MSDGVDMVTVGTHGGAATAAGLVVAFLSRLVASRSQEKVAIELALLRAQLDDVKKEIHTLRERSHEYGNKLTRIEVKMGIEDTNPRARAP